MHQSALFFCDVLTKMHFRQVFCPSSWIFFAHPPVLFTLYSQSRGIMILYVLYDSINP
jgi:hypothetical protein